MKPEPQLKVVIPSQLIDWTKKDVVAIGKTIEVLLTMGIKFNLKWE